MCFQPFPRLWWCGIYKKSTKMVDFKVNLEDWLQNASFFSNESVGYPISIDDLLSNEKENTEGDPAILGFPDLEWLDEKVDLAVLDNRNDLPDHLNETPALMNDDYANLWGFLDGGNNLSYLPLDAFKNVLTDCLNSEDCIEPTSSEILDTHLASPGCTILQVNSPTSFTAQSPVSPYSNISDAPEETSGSVLQSSDTSSLTSDLVHDDFDMPEIVVAVCDNVASPSSSSDEVLSIEEVSNSMRKRKFVSNGEDIPKVKVILKEFSHPVGRSSKPKDRRERKKIQNKEAAARYRNKKRIEDNELSGVVADLESTQKKLKQKHDELQSEIKYLKSLMCEILQKKGIIK